MDQKENLNHSSKPLETQEQINQMKNQLKYAKENLEKYNQLLEEIEKKKTQPQNKNTSSFVEKDLDEKLYTLRNALFQTRCDMFSVAERLRSIEYSLTSRVMTLEKNYQEIKEFLDKIEIVGYYDEDEENFENEGEDKDDDL